MKHNLRTPFLSIAIICFCLFVLFQTPGFATWNKIGQFATTINTSFFFNDQRGFIGIDGVNGIKRTSDGGQTWLDCIIPSGFYGFITDIYMKDSLHGWATIENGNSSNGLWSTTDGGASWQMNTSVTGQISSVYQTPYALIISSRFSPNKLSVSNDGGAHFIEIAPNNYLGINFADSLHGVVSAMSSSGNNGLPNYYPSVRTTDGGLTWNPTEGVLTEAWSVYSQKGSANFFIAGEKSALDPSPSENVYGSSDYGATWQAISTLGGRTTGHIDGVGNVMYVQSDNNNPLGFHRSTDGGRTWVNVGGPSNYRDTRFSVVGCNGAIVYAFDESGGVWKTTDGGDGLFAGSSARLNSGQITLTAELCSMDSSSITYSNISCNNLRIESLGFTDSASNIVKSGALSFLRYPKLPETVSSLSDDSLRVKWEPARLGGAKPITNISIKMHGTISGSVFDTLIAVTVLELPAQPDTYPTSIDFGEITSGNKICSTFVLRNSAPAGSPPFILESAVFTNLDTAYRITSTPSKFPLSVAAQDSLTLEVCFAPKDSALHQDSLLIKTDCFSFRVSLDGRGLVIPDEVKSSPVQQSFLIRPNPAQNEISIEFQSDILKETQIEIFDALGKKVFSEQRNMLGGMNVIHIDTRSFAAGIYMVRIGEMVQSFVKE